MAGSKLNIFAAWHVLICVGYIFSSDGMYIINNYYTTVTYCEMLTHTHIFDQHNCI